MTSSLLKISEDEIRGMRGEGETYIGLKRTEDEATPLFRNEANQIVPRVQTFNSGYSRNRS